MSRRAELLHHKAGKPFVADFGLALREQDVGKGSRFAGTPAYMSPEQARGEGHRVDGRSDIFSLGVVLYELLVGRRPFRAESTRELLYQINNFEVRPPRQHDEGIPKELERICLKSLAKRASDRYTTASDLADDLRHFIAAARKMTPAHAPAEPRVPGSEPIPHTPSVTPDVTAGSDQRPLRIVPRGLRSFDAGDAEFFLELVPGPRDRDGLPESIRFWKRRIEDFDADRTFRLGLVYGPSGCGKSSLMKAGLLPRLAPDVAVIYVEATPDSTETRIVRELEKRYPDAMGSDAASGVDLPHALANLRRGRGLAAGKKLLIVLDQFEQWLHAKRAGESTELVQALRQCDGARVQAIVLVRDDFWLAVSRFLSDLEVELVQGQNCALVDLGDPRHATKVLTAFGCAFAALPEDRGQLTAAHSQFLAEAIEGLAEDGKIISVRLALFAEMVKGKPWTPNTLRDMGGTGGVGVTFLEETFSATTANPKHRLHQNATRR